MRSNAVISIVVACSLMPHSSSWLHRCVYGAAMLLGADSANGNLTASLCRSRRPPLRTGGRCRIRTVRTAPVPPNWSTQAHRSHTTCCRVCASFSRPRRTTAYARARERLSQSALLRKVGLFTIQVHQTRVRIAVEIHTEVPGKALHVHATATDRGTSARTTPIAKRASSRRCGRMRPVNRGAFDGCGWSARLSLNFNDINLKGSALVPPTSQPILVVFSPVGVPAGIHRVTAQAWAPQLAALLMSPRIVPLQTQTRARSRADRAASG
jgi:hypothetical protein